MTNPGAARVLVIDDDSQIRALTVEMLEAEGYRVDSAADGTAGLRIAYRESPDLILCDVQMGGVNGYEVLTALRRDPRTEIIPVIFFTGVGGDTAVRHGMNLGADDYLVKPISTELLVRAVRARLNRSAVFRREAARRLEELRTDLARSFLPHELLTPLTAVMALSSLLMEEGAIEAAEVKEVAKGILLGAQNLKEMITKFLLYAEIQATGAGQALGQERVATVLAEPASRARRPGARAHHRPPAGRHVRRGVGLRNGGRTWDDCTRSVPQSEHARRLRLIFYNNLSCWRLAADQEAYTF